MPTKAAKNLKVGEVIVIQNNSYQIQEIGKTTDLISGKPQIIIICQKPNKKELKTFYFWENTILYSKE